MTRAHRLPRFPLALWVREAAADGARASAALTHATERHRDAVEVLAHATNVGMKADAVMERNHISNAIAESFRGAPGV